MRLLKLDTTKRTVNKMEFTESAERVLRRAAILAERNDPNGEVSLRYVLLELARDESQAADLLAREGVTAEMIATELCCEDSDVSSVELHVRQAKRMRIGIDQNCQLQSVVDAATSRACECRSDDLSSEHLLWGLTVVASSVSKFLESNGIVPASFPPIESKFGEPLAVDFEIQWDAKPRSGANPPPLAKGGPGGVAPIDDSLHEDPDQKSIRGTPLDPPLARGGTLSVLRTIDAAANRAREGLRVIEDYVRFELDDAHLTNELKSCRHDLATALSIVDSQSLITMRDTPGDVGTRITTESETRRATVEDVLLANFKRVQESVRSLEEFGKTISPDLGTRCEAVRYRLYTIEKAVLTTLHNRERLTDCRLYLLLTRELCERNPEDALSDAITGGVDVVQIREKSMSDRELLAWCQYVVDAAKAQALPGTGSQSSPLVIVNDRPDIAVLANADGVHVGQEELSVAECRRIVGPDKLVGVSTHTIEQARQAVLDGADYLGVGPVFPSGTKCFDDFPGLDFVAEVAAEITLPWFAIGGITGENINAVLEAGGKRVAVSGAVCRSTSPLENATLIKAKVTARG